MVLDVPSAPQGQLSSQLSTLLQIPECIETGHHVIMRLLPQQGHNSTTISPSLNSKESLNLNLFYIYTVYIYIDL